MAVSNRDVARVLSEVADLLELEGQNPFRVRRYREVARAVASLRRELSEAVAAGVDLALLPLGDLAAKVGEVLETGGLGFLEDLRDRVPAGLLDVVRLEGVGPRRARLLRGALGVEDVAGLLRAAEAGRLRDLEGFGIRSEAAVLEAARAWRPRLFLRDDVGDAAAVLLDAVGGLDGARCSVAGAPRRCVEGVDRLEFVVAGAAPDAVLATLGKAPGVRDVHGGGDRVTATLASGLPVAVRVVEPGAFGAALFLATGSAAHVEAARGRAEARGLRLEASGIHRDGARVGGAEERDVFDALGVPAIPPELREGRGEWEAAEAGALPRLLERSDLRGDLHLHTTRSDGRHDLEAMVQAARASGLEYVAVTDHSPHPRVARGMDAEALRERNRAIDALNDRLDGFRVLRGAEVDVHRDGRLDYPDDVLAELDVVVCSVHRHLHLPRREQTERVLRAMSHPRAHVLGHPTARRIGRRGPIDLDWERVLDAAADGGWALELDGQPKRLDLDADRARAAREAGIPLVVSSDAHAVPELRQLGYAVEQARRAWLEPDDVLNTRSVEGFLEALR